MMRDVRVRQHTRRHEIKRVRSREGMVGYSGLPPMAKRFTMKDAEPILRELGKLDGRGAFKRAEVVGSVATRGSSDHDLDIIVVIDPSKVGVNVEDLDRFFEWLNSDDNDVRDGNFTEQEVDKALRLVRGIHKGMKDSGAYFLPGSETDPESWVLVRGNHSVPVDLWYTWETDEMERGSYEEQERILRMLREES